MNILTGVIGDYLSAVGQFKDFSTFVSADAVFMEHPNAINPNGKKRNLAEALKGLETGRTMLLWQKYAVKNSIESGSTVFTEVEWTGKMAIDAGRLRQGQLLRAFCALRFDFVDEKIVQQTSYDCYEPF